MSRRRVVVTGLGVVSPLGNDVETTWRALLAGQSGVGFIRDFSTEKLRSDIAASVKDFDVSPFLGAKEAEIHGRVTHFCVAAATEAMTHAGLSHLRPASPDDVDEARRRSRMGCLVSTGMGSVDVFEAQIDKSRERGPRAVSPYFVPGVMPNAAAAVISMRFGLMGPSFNLASACATGTHSIATGTLMIESGDADVMLVGGSEAATQLNTVAGFGNARALARSVEGDPTKASRPFDKKRSGFVMGEGAGALVLEAEEHAKARGAVPLAYVAGFGMATDAEHLTRPHSTGLGLAFAVEKALQRAGIGPGDVGYINPHATSTMAGDVAEYESLRRVFGDRLAEIPMSATKSMIGHLLGGAGAVESIAVVCSLRDQTLHPSINVDDLDPVFAIQLVAARREADVRYALKCSAGFGGHNCALVLERA
jgi:3-oxoacyl-[acyl-carrier-protein] synthase II